MPGETKPHRKGAASGDTKAFESLIKGISEDLHAAGIAESLVSDVVAEMWIAIKEGRYDPGRSARAFAHGIARNKKMQEQRDQKKQPPVGQLSEAEQKRFESEAVTKSHPAKRRLDPDLKTARRQVGQAVMDALEQIINKHVPEELKEHARLKYMKGIPTRETAKRLGFEPDTLTARDRELAPKIRKHLKAMLAPKLTIAVTRVFEDLV